MRKGKANSRTPASRKLRRRSYYVDPHALTKARRLLGAASDSEAVRIALERVVEMEAHRRFMEKSHGTLKPGSIELP
jgi:hypothetical protein